MNLEQFKQPTQEVYQKVNGLSPRKIKKTVLFYFNILFSIPKISIYLHFFFMHTASRLCMYSYML